MEKNIISSNLRAIRTERKVTVKELSEKTGIPIRSYQDYEYGRSKIGVDPLKKLADFYGVSVDFLIGREVQENPIKALSLKFQMTELEEEILINYLKLSPKSRKEISEMVKSLGSDK